MAATIRSSIGMALAGKTEGVDNRKLDDGALHDGFTAVGTSRSNKHGMLPTPPNSISPNLPPHPFQNHAARLQSPRSSPTNVDSDIDLQDAVEHARSQDQPEHHALSYEALDKLGSIDSAGAITPSMLAKHHLPGILLNHGPLAIRHVMGYLTTSVPGFSRIPPAKARRLVVGALEGKGGSADGAGRSGDIEFEKVGWGRWDATIRGQPPRERRASSGSAYTANGLPIPGKHAISLRGSTAYSGRSFSSEGASLSHFDVGEHDADKMSMDEDDKHASRSASEAADERVMDDLDGDVTEEEDWAAIGAAALRARSLPTHSVPRGRSLHQPTLAQNYRKIKLIPRRPSSKARALHSERVTKFPLSIGVNAGDLQEREAVEALLKLGSM
ncbi:MAG: hypothetical protein Q9227_001744 [Pyrenula ochraceoflavens]